MVTITIQVDYIDKGQIKNTLVTASAKTYTEAHTKAMRLVEEFVAGKVLSTTAPYTVKSIVYT